MSYEIYKLMHVVGIAVLFLGLGGAFALAKAEKGRGGWMALHGIGALLVLVGGFGMHARKQLTWEPWLIIKVVLWVGLGALPILVKRGVIPAALGWMLAVLFGTGAVYLVLMGRQLI